MSFAESFIKQFDRMVKRDGGEVTLIGVEDSCIVVGYKAGHDPECTDGVCIMPHVELQEMMAEQLARREPNMSVRVVRVS
jgi:hypothetical protein